jgi:hypothetical protein
MEFVPVDLVERSPGQSSRRSRTFRLGGFALIVVAFGVVLLLAALAVAFGVVLFLETRVPR